MKFINEIKRLQQLAGLLSENINKNEEALNIILKYYPNIAKKVKQDNPIVSSGNTFINPLLIKGKGRLNLNKIPGIKYDMGAEDIEYDYAPDKGIFEINYYGDGSTYYNTDEESINKQDKKLKELGFGGFIEADLSQPHIFPKANGINITNVISYFDNKSNIAKTIDNSLNSGGYLFIWDHFNVIENMINTFSSYKLLEILPMDIEDVDFDRLEDDIASFDGFDGDDVSMLFKK